MAEPLSTDEIDQQLNELPGWEYKDDKLTKEFSFDNFRDAMSFITRLSYEAEEQVHHPEIFNVYNTVEISLSTHDAGGKVTEKDIALAKTIESLHNN
ncbi:4a-hydroxytetrahydrobiopterin dehydratase [Fodinibius sediminis]|uniref:Putative pterin-4-alpha-carbinolamine dehydratase n=1 Tax=Fodinibius sediminis TaxID=1214077 RepID=A0A521B9G9_9BACT|nr:4a-hydroxytetrahydrobiopterin dehydratase [Fodinibius sediminis]SMO43738.1 4a-hydroxytetrahydrobiopterin dehydratase [Fodinibius sediminis]